MDSVPCATHPFWQANYRNCSRLEPLLTNQEKGAFSSTISKEVLRSQLDQSFLVFSSSPIVQDPFYCSSITV